MRDYSFKSNHLVRKMLPAYIRGRKLTMYMYSLIHPLDAVSEKFNLWCKDTMIIANMTSQPILFDNYLNYRLRKYFANQEDGINVITNIETERTKDVIATYLMSYPPIYKPVYTHMETEDEDEPHTYLMSEIFPGVAVKPSFYVFVPQCNTDIIDEGRYMELLVAYIERYKLPSKSYEIIVKTDNK